LIFPERRQRRRIVTLKNAAWFFGIALVLVIAFSTYNEHRHRDPLRPRLSESTEPALERDFPTRRSPIVIEASDTPHQNPTYSEGGHPLTFAPPLVAAGTPKPTVQSAPRPEVPHPPQLTLKEAQERHERIVITDSTHGVRVDVQPAPQPAPPVTTTEDAQPPR